MKRWRKKTYHCCLQSTSRNITPLHRGRRGPSGSSGRTFYGVLESYRKTHPCIWNVRLLPIKTPNSPSVSSNRITPNTNSAIQISLDQAMDVRMFGMENHPLFTALQQLVEVPDEMERTVSNVPSQIYVRDAKAMAATPADVKELPGRYVFEVDMPGVKSGDIKVQVEENVLVISGERKREEDKEGKYLRMERRVGKFMRKFSLPENADAEKVAAVCKDGVLVVTVEKLPPPEPKKPKTIEVKIA